MVDDYCADLSVAGCVIVELKAAGAIAREHETQLLNYLRATDKEVELLMNFGPQAEFRQRVLANDRKMGGG